jgi:siroheme synthase-like protein
VRDAEIDHKKHKRGNTKHKTQIVLFVLFVSSFVFFVVNSRIQMRYYPIYLDLKDRAVLVVGGGAIAEGKTQQLVEAGARVRVVSPTLTPHLSGLVTRGVIEHVPGRFKKEDLQDVSLVISATDDQAANEEVARLAGELALLYNIVDQPSLCNFITPALVTRGELQISVSTGGGSPSLTQRVKREVAALIGEEYGELLEIATEMRAAAKQRIPDFERRRKVLHEFVESDAIDLIRAGRSEDARELARSLLEDDEVQK